MQQSPQVYFDISRIAAKSFFRGSPAETARLKVLQELCAQIGDEPLESPADRGFMNMQDARDLKKGLAIQKIGGEQKAVLGREALERSLDCMGEAREFCRKWGAGSYRRGHVKGIERSLAMNATVMIDMTLGERCAEPAKKRATTGVRSQRGAALPIDLTETVEL